MSIMTALHRDSPTVQQRITLMTAAVKLVTINNIELYK